MKITAASLFSVAVSGCAVEPVQQKNNVPVSYFEQQAFAEKTPAQQWKEMRRESEVQEISDARWKPKPKQVAAAAAAVGKKLPKANVAKDDKQPEQPETKPVK